MFRTFVVPVPVTSARYVRAIELMDAKLAAFWQAMTTAGLLDDTLCVLTSDHGEAFGDHDLYQRVVDGSSERRVTELARDRVEAPHELVGALYRIGPNPQFEPRDPNHHWFAGDGMLHALVVGPGVANPPPVITIPARMVITIDGPAGTGKSTVAHATTLRRCAAPRPHAR